MTDFGLGDDIVNEKKREAALRHHFGTYYYQPEQPPHEEMAAAVKNAVTKFVGKLTTPEQFLYVRRRLERMLEFLSEMEAEHGVRRSGKKTTRASAG